MPIFYIGVLNHSQPMRKSNTEISARSCLTMPGIAIYAALIYQQLFENIHGEFTLKEG